MDRAAGSGRRGKHFSLEALELIVVDHVRLSKPRDPLKQRRRVLNRPTASGPKVPNEVLPTFQHGLIDGSRGFGIKVFHRPLPGEVGLEQMTDSVSRRAREACPQLSTAALDLKPGCNP